MENDKIIKLLKSSNRDDVILGLTFLNKKSYKDWENVFSNPAMKTEGYKGGWKWVPASRGKEYYYGRKKGKRRLLLNDVFIYIYYKEDTVNYWKRSGFKPL